MGDKGFAKGTNNKHNFWNPFRHWNRYYPLNYSKVFYSSRIKHWTY
jgi:hypothetical protein